MSRERALVLIEQAAAGGETKIMGLNTLGSVYVHSVSSVMNLTQTLQEIETLSVSERIDLVQAIWDSIADTQVYPDLTTAQKQTLDQRIADTEADPSNVLTWREVRESIQD